MGGAWYDVVSRLDPGDLGPAPKGDEADSSGTVVCLELGRLDEVEPKLARLGWASPSGGPECLRRWPLKLSSFGVELLADWEMFSGAASAPKAGSGPVLFGS